MKTILKNLLSIMLFLLVISGCDKDKDKVIRTPEEEHILEAAYSKDFSYPVGFYHEVNDTGSPYYENTVSIKPINERQDIWIELYVYSGLIDPSFRVIDPSAGGNNPEGRSLLSMQ